MQVLLTCMTILDTCNSQRNHTSVSRTFLCSSSVLVEARFIALSGYRFIPLHPDASECGPIYNAPWKSKLDIRVMPFSNALRCVPRLVLSQRLRLTALRCTVEKCTFMRTKEVAAVCFPYIVRNILFRAFIASNFSPTADEAQ